MDFDPANIVHRYLLSDAVRDWRADLAIPMTSNIKDANPKDSVLLRLRSAPHNIGISRDVLQDIVTVDPERTTPKLASAVAEALSKLKPPYWPLNFADSTRRLAGLFGGLDKDSLRTLACLEGQYVSYQFSSRQPDRILIGRATIGPRTKWGNALVTNHIAHTATPGVSITYAGIAFGGHKAAHILFRAEGADGGFPQLVHLDPAPAPEFLFGTALGGARTALRHLTSIAFHRADYPLDDTPIPPDYEDRLPEMIRRHMVCVLKHGPTNYPPSYIYTPIADKAPATIVPTEDPTSV